MILYILEYLNIPSLYNFLNYLTVRTGFALFTSFFFILLFGPALINKISSYQSIGQPIREDGPESHIIAKKGTPTMGGIIILLSIVGSILLWVNPESFISWPVIFILVSFGLIGFADDLSKVKNNSSKGISAEIRIFLQIIVSLIFIYWITKYHHIDIKLLSLPFLKDIFINLGLFAVPFILIVILGSANAVNLTDGLDGLATVPVVLVAGCFAFISYVTGNIVFSEYLQIPYIANVGEASIFCGAMVGSCLGFLWYNAPPAKIFMGDTGSLSLGAAMGTIAIILKKEILLVIIGGVFVVEALSVILQVSFFKYSKKKYGKGVRFFLMAPLHHHYELKGLNESKIVIRFWIVGILLSLLAIITLKVQ